VFSGVLFVGIYKPFEIDWADSNNDGRVNGTDLNSINTAMFTTDTYWDFNRDGSVNYLDYGMFGSLWSSTFGLARFPGHGLPDKTMDPGWKALCYIFREPGQILLQQVNVNPEKFADAFELLKPMAGFCFDPETKRRAHMTTDNMEAAIPAKQDCFIFATSDPAFHM
jgi:hypothetical protein